MSSIKNIIKVVSFPVLLFLLFGFAPAEDWELARDKHGVKVYTRKTEGTKLKDSRAIAIFDASTDEIVEILLDFNAYADWIPRCSESYLLKKVSDNEFYYYSVYSAPWPVADRDLIAHINVVHRENGVVEIHLKGVADYMEKKKKKVRIPNFEGVWILRPEKPGKVYAINEYSSDPGGKLPQWLANSAAVDSPFDTFINLRERLSQMQSN